MIETPVPSSPAMIARSIGAAPRHRGSSDGCTFSISQRDSSGSVISAPNAHTSTTSGRARAIVVDRRLVVDRRRLVERDAELAGGVGDRRRRQLAAAAARAGRGG